MRVINANIQFMSPVDGADALKRIEACGRTCYKSEDKISDSSAEKFVRNIVKRGHLAVLEHYSFTVKFICDRGVSHELVRHRLASFCQESTRYCSYDKDKFGNEITVIRPCYLRPCHEELLEGSISLDEVPEEVAKYITWYRTCEIAEQSYFQMLELGCTPQEARAVLPNSLKTEVVMTANLREWRHFLDLRCSTAAHPQMREVSLLLLDKVSKEIPVVFDDLWEKYGQEES